MIPMDDPVNAIEISGFKKRYGRFFAVKGLDLVVPRGTFFGFVGPNGAGKSTTINAIVGLLRPSGGTIKVAGFDVERQPLEVKKRVGFMPEETVLYERLTATEFLNFTGKMYGMNERLIERRSRELLKLLDLEGDKFMGAFSLGMKKKASLAAALIHDPEVIILDEPFSGIDATTAARIRGTLSEMVDKGDTVFFASHVLETVERISRRIGIIHKGKLHASGTLDEIRALAQCDPHSSLEEVFLKLVGSQEEC
jgi:ABC-2 type transport system ATP-binding protein